MTVAGKVLYYGDNLDVLRKRIKDESIDLIYLDPPFNSNRTYNVLFGRKSGEDASAHTIDRYVKVYRDDVREAVQRNDVQAAAR